MANKLIAGIRSQTLQVDELLVIDSCSTDDTVGIFKNAGAKVRVIPRASFDHGRTRQLAVDMEPEADFIIFLTQDVIIESADVFEKLLATFSDKQVGAAYGRQMPSPDATPISIHARLYNYSSENSIKSINDVRQIGIKTAFLSDSFSVYRRFALMSVGGFPSNIVFGEDTYVAAKLILNNWKIAYCAEAQVYHSHNLSVAEEFRRYFDIGVFHSCEKWYIDSLGKAEGEGKTFVISELDYLMKKAPWLIPSAVLRTMLKLIGYNLGKLEHSIPIRVKKHLSKNKGYWKKG